ncbi:thioredoxin family protein [Roseivirga pacifica]|uniref:thioredoxin family protein n=1 Tax=Roseivirga pacifica TaxID=1267423 RepID=UPI00227CEB72|nr:thioredoxin family protein [Roseivirga pacifica]
MKGNMGVITQTLLDEGMSYQAYRSLIDKLMDEGKTTGPKQTAAYVDYARMSQKRMKKWEKVGKLSEQLVEQIAKVNRPMTWLVITEGWCGDAGQTLPFMHKMAEANELIDLKLVLRDEQPELMDQFLTNGGRSIPILIAIDTATLQVLGKWGPRPEVIQREFLANKVSQERTGTEFSEYMHLWYAKDKGASIQSEFLAILGVWIQKQQSLPVQAG